MSRVFLPLLVAASLLGAHFELAAADSASTPAPATLTLAQAQQLLRTRNIDLQIAQRAVQAASADVVTAKERPNATVSLNSASINPNGGVGSGSLWNKHADSIFRIDQPFERGDKRKHRVDAAHSALEAAQQDFIESEREQNLAVAQAYYDLERKQDRRDIALDIKALEDKSLDAANLRLRLGDIARLDLARLRVEAARAQNDLTTAESDLRGARITLAALLDLSHEADQLHAVDAWPLPEKTADADVDAILTRRPDILAADARVHQAEAALEGARAQRKRDITVGLQYEHFPPDASNTLGFGISVPLFTGNNYSGEIARANADIDSAIAQRDKVRINAEAEVRQAQSDLHAAEEKYRRYNDELLSQARSAAAMAEIAYTQGASSLTDLLDARRELHDAEDDAVDARADYANALAALRAAFTTSRVGAIDETSTARLFQHPQVELPALP